MNKEIIRNVLIKDGNRTVNWDFKADSTVREVLQLWKFEWEPDSVKICGKPVPDNMLDHPLSDYWLWKGSVVITMVPKKKGPQKKEEAAT